MNLYKNIAIVIAVLCGTANLSMAVESLNPGSSINQKNMFSFTMLHNNGEEKTETLPFELLKFFLEKTADPSNITYLDLSGLPLTELPNNLDRFTNLKGLDLRDCPLTHIDLTKLSGWDKHRNIENLFFLGLGSDTPIQKINLPRGVFFKIERADKKPILIDAKSIQREEDLSNFASLLGPKIIGDQENKVIIGFKGESDYLMSLIDQEKIQRLRIKLFTQKLPSDDDLVKISSDENCLEKKATIDKFSPYRELDKILKLAKSRPNLSETDKERSTLKGDKKLLVINLLKEFLPEDSVNEASLKAEMSLKNKLSDKTFLENILLDKPEFNKYLMSLNEGQGLMPEQRNELAQSLINKDLLKTNFLVNALLEKAVSIEDYEQKLRNFLESKMAIVDQFTKEILASLKPFSLEELTIVNRYLDIPADHSFMGRKPFERDIVKAHFKSYSYDLRMGFYGIFAHLDPRNITNLDEDEITISLRESLRPFFDALIRYIGTKINNTRITYIVGSPW